MRRNIFTPSTTFRKETIAKPNYNWYDGEQVKSQQLALMSMVTECHHRERVHQSEEIRMFSNTNFGNLCPAIGICSKKRFESVQKIKRAAASQVRAELLDYSLLLW